MEQIYDEVPDIISGKDLDYLSDMFNWNYGAYKSTINSMNVVQDQELKSILEHASNIFHSNLTNILNILSNGGENE